MKPTKEQQQQVDYLFSCISCSPAEEIASIDKSELETKLVTNYGYSPHEAYMRVKTGLAQALSDRRTQDMGLASLRSLGSWLKN